MLPSRMDFVRKSYSSFVKEQLVQLGETLASLPEMPGEPQDWSFTVTLPRVLTHTESFQIRQELALAGWGSVLKYHGPNREDLMIYIPMYI